MTRVDKTIVKSPVIFLGLSFGVISLLLNGCVVESLDDQSSSPVCVTNSDCPASQICRSGYCSVQEAPDASLNLELLPSRFSNYKAQRKLDFSVSKVPTRLGLQPSVRIRSDGEPGLFFSTDRSPPTGLLLFEPLGEQIERFSHKTFVDEGQFSTSVAPGEYWIRFMAASQRLPSYSWRVRIESNTVFRRELTTPAQNPDIEGAIRYSPSDSEAQQPLQGAKIYAISRDGRNDTTSAITDENGTYRIQARPNSGTYDLVVDKSSENPWIPRHIFENAFVVEQQKIQFSESLGNISMSPIEVTVNIEVTDSNEELGEIDLSGSHLLARKEGENRFERRIELEQNRRQVFIELIPGRYRLSLAPPANSVLNNSTATVDTRADDMTATIELTPKSSFLVKTVDSRGRAVPNTRVQLKNDEGDPFFDQITFQSGEDGAARVRLDSKTSYRGLIRPPNSTGLPDTPVHIESTSLQGDSEEPVELKIAKPYLFRGNVLDNNQASPIRDTQVRVLSPEGSVIGYEKTDRDGRFNIILPASF